MKKVLFIILFVVFSLAVANADKKKSYWLYDSDDDKKERNYQHGGEYRWQDGYFKKDGDYVKPHWKTYPDEYKWNNKNQDKED